MSRTSHAVLASRIILAIVAVAAVAASFLLPAATNASLRLVVAVVAGLAAVGFGLTFLAPQQLPSAEDPPEIEEATEPARALIELESSDADGGRFLREHFDAAHDAYESKGVRLLYSAPPPSTIHIDQVLLGGVLDRLLQNALAHTNDGNSVIVQGGHIGTDFIVRVIDDGIGFSEEPELANSREIVEAHGGTFAAWSPGEGKGATYTVRLPLVAKQGLPLPEPEPDEIPAGEAPAD